MKGWCLNIFRSGLHNNERALYMVTYTARVFNKRRRDIWKKKKRRERHQKGKHAWEGSVEAPPLPLSYWSVGPITRHTVCPPLTSRTCSLSASMPSFPIPPLLIHKRETASTSRASTLASHPHPLPPTIIRVWCITQPIPSTLVNWTVSLSLYVAQRLYIPIQPWHYLF